MNLNSALQDKLDAPVKSFEVAFRCYVSDTLLKAYPDEEGLKNELTTRNNNLKQNKTILTDKFQPGISRILNNWESFWENLAFAKECQDKQDHSYEHDVAFVSQVLLITYTFRELFQALISQFKNPTQYFTLSQKYYDARNALSHRASSIINETDAKGCIQFIQTVSDYLPDHYYWYCSKPKITKLIQDYQTELNQSALMIDNLSIAPFPMNKIVCREPEIADLFKYVCGWDGEKRSRNRKHITCLSGYGGIGKTSLVLEFVTQLLDTMKQFDYTGFRPSFILFYSAKERILDISNETGEIIQKRMKMQFHSAESLKELIFGDLSIAGFDDYWKTDGIIIIDNLETLQTAEREQIMNFLYDELPSSVQAIITTRIPEKDVDFSLPLKGFQNEAGIEFIKQFVQQNEFPLDLSEAQMKDLVKYSFGNSLVLVLALKRLSSKKSTFSTIRDEMKNLPSDNSDGIIPQFMFQNTIKEIQKIYSDKEELINSILLCLTIAQKPLSAVTLMAAHKEKPPIISDIEDILNLLTEYLIADKVENTYQINEFAGRFILVDMKYSTDYKNKWEQNLRTALNDDKRKKEQMESMKEKDPDLAKIINDWKINEEEEETIRHAFDLYSIIQQFSSTNADYQLDQLRLDVEKIRASYGDHPYLYYQYARILKELRRKGFIDSRHDEIIVDNYEKCFMMLDSSSYSKIKQTKTYPSILYLFALYLYDISSYQKASGYALQSMQTFESLNLKTDEYYDAIAVYCLSETALYQTTKEKKYLTNASKNHCKIKHRKYSIIKQHLKILKKELSKYGIKIDIDNA